MEETLRLELLAKTKQALDADDWSAVVRLWQPWAQQGDPAEDNDAIRQQFHPSNKSDS